MPVPTGVLRQNVGAVIGRPLDLLLQIKIATAMHRIFPPEIPMIARNHRAGDQWSPLQEERIVGDTGPYK